MPQERKDMSGLALPYPKYSIELGRKVLESRLPLTSPLPETALSPEVRYKAAKNLVIEEVVTQGRFH